MQVLPFFPTGTAERVEFEVLPPPPLPPSTALAAIGFWLSARVGETRELLGPDTHRVVPPHTGEQLR